MRTAAISLSPQGAGVHSCLLFCFLTPRLERSRGSLSCLFLSMWQEKYKELLPVALKMWGLSKVFFHTSHVFVFQPNPFFPYSKSMWKLVRLRVVEGQTQKFVNSDEKLSSTLLPLTHYWNFLSSIISQTTTHSDVITHDYQREKLQILAQHFVMQADFKILFVIIAC